MPQRAPGVLALALTIAAALAPVGPAEAAKILLLYSSRYTHLGGNNGHPPEEQEADNVKAALLALGHAVTTIAGPDDPVGDCGFGNGNVAPGTRLATAGEYRTALAAADVFLIPEHSRFCSLAFDITPDIVGVWRTWVAQGGGLVISVGYEGRNKIPDLLEVLFGFHLAGLDGTGVVTTRTPEAATTLFATAPATLAGNAGMGLIALASLPPGSASVYDDGTNTSVAILPYGAGKIVLLGWDWAYSDPPFSGLQNGGWFPAVLQGAVEEAWAKRLTVAAAAGGGSVTADTVGLDTAIACGAQCRAHYPRGTAVTLAATAAEGWAFAGWSGGGCSGTGPCRVVLAEDTAVAALFVRPFIDVPAGYWAQPWIEALVGAGVTAGCSADPPGYCPEAPVTREAMAVFLLKAKDGPGAAPPPCTTPPFADVSCASPFAPWIQALVARGITAGCGPSSYCPTGPVTREQMAVFLLKTLEGASYAPPVCRTARFGDVPCASPFAAWIQELVRRGITAGCGASAYCPRAPVTRAEMAVFLVKTFGLPVP